MIKHSESELDSLFSALSDAKRRAIVAELRSRECTVTQLQALGPGSLVAALKHVEVLERAGIIETVKRGRTRICRLKPDRLQQAEAWLAETRSFWLRSLAQLNAHLKDAEQ